MRTIDTDLQAVATLVKVLELGSFRAAARSLGIAKSTASAKLAGLEAQLGVRLVERTTRRVRITEAGSAYHRHVAHVLDAIADGERAIAGLQAEPRGRLRMTAPADFDAGVLAAALGDYARRYPGVEVEVELADRRVDLVGEGFDLALRQGPLDDSSLVVRELGRPQRLVTCASAAYLARHGRPRRPHELARHRCLAMMGHREPVRWRYYLRRRAVTVEVRPAIAVNSFAVLQALAIAGHGIVRLPERYADARLHRILDDFAPPPRRLHALYPSRHAGARVRAFIDLLEQHL
jgi:DNA-binding transcriptional LysR family regulator